MCVGWCICFVRFDFLIWLIRNGKMKMEKRKERTMIYWSWLERYYYASNWKFVKSPNSSICSNCRRFDSLSRVFFLILILNLKLAVTSALWAFPSTSSINQPNYMYYILRLMTMCFKRENIHMHTHYRVREWKSRKEDVEL